MVIGIRNLMWASAIAVAALGWNGANQAAAADLRSNIGDRTFVRTSQLDPAADDAPEAAPERSDGPPAPIPMRKPAPRTQTQPPSSILAEPFADDGACYDGGACGMGCCPTGHWWGGADFLMWYRRGHSLPPLVSTGALPIGDVLYGQDDVGVDMRAGGRFEIGRWVDDCESLGYGGRMYFLGDIANDFNAQTSAALPVVAVPFINSALNGIEDSLEIGNLGLGANSYAGSVDVRTTSSVWGGDAFLRWQICDTGCARVDVLAGYQFAGIDESLSIVSTGLVPTVTLSDSFTTRNRFHGGSLGLISHWYGPRVRVEFLTKVALGNMHQEVTIAGAGSNDGGIFARTTNIGAYSRNKFAVSPELGVNCVLPLTPRLDFVVGYSAIFWSNVMQPAGAVDRRLNLTPTPPAPNPARPEFNFFDNDYWVHGVNLGIACRF